MEERGYIGYVQARTIDEKQSLLPTNEPNQAKIPRLSITGRILWGITFGWCLFFSIYIVYGYFLHPANISLAFPSMRGAVFMIIHWVGGIILMTFGPFQLIPRIRIKYIQVHIWMGRIYLFATVLCCIGGLTFIGLQGTVGGISMDVAFSIYGILFLLCACMAFYYARQKKIQLHKEWAIRTFSLGIASAWYRILIGPIFFSLLFGKTKWITPAIDSMFLGVAAWTFFFPNLLICELYFYFKWDRGMIKAIALWLKHE